jgi:uncharacterized delta-60 repeat protein
MTFTRAVGGAATAALLAGALGAIAASPAAAAPGDSDTAFNTAVSAMILNNQITDIDELADGRIAIAGSFTQPRADVALLDADGGLDASFQVGAGIVDFNDVRTVTARQVNGDTKILIGGNYVDNDSEGLTDPWYGMDQLNADGSLDQSFRNNMRATVLPLRVQNVARSFVVQPDGKVLVGGTFCRNFTDPNDGTLQCAFATNLLRLNSNGTLDSSFTSNTENAGWAADGGATPSVENVQLQSDGKIVVGGNFGAPGSGVARFNSDGTPDTTFNNQVLSDNVLDAGSPGTNVEVAVQSDGKIVAAGNFNTGTLRSVARFNANGTADTAFNTNIGTTLSQKSALDLAIDSAGGILVAGLFNNVNNGHDYVARFDSTGTLDTTFTPDIVGNDLQAEGVWAIEVSASNRILVGGKWGSDPRNYIQRYYGQPETPAAPSGVTATAGNGQATVSWTAPTFDGGANVSGYRIDIRLAGGGWATSVGDTGSTTTSHTVTGLANGLAVEFRVAAINSVGAGDYSTGSNTVTPTAPTADPPPTTPPVANPPATTPPVANPPATTPPAPTTPPVAATAPGKIAKAKVKAKKSKKGKRKYLLKLKAPGEDGGAEITGYEYRIKAKVKRTGKKIKAKWTDWQSFNPATQTTKVKKAVNKLRKYPRGTKAKIQIRAVNSVGPGPATTVKTKIR